MFQLSATYCPVDINFFKETDKWVEDVRAEYIIIMLVGNKIDLNNKRKGITATASGIPRAQSQWGGSTVLYLLGRSYLCQGSERSWVQGFEGSWS